MKREKKDTASDMALNGLPTPQDHPIQSDGSSSPIPTLFLISPPPALMIPPDFIPHEAGERVTPAPDGLLTAHTRAYITSQAWVAGPDLSSVPVPTADEFLTPHSTTLTYVQSEARLGTDEKDLSGEAAEVPCCECCGCIVS